MHIYIILYSHTNEHNEAIVHLGQWSEHIHEQLLVQFLAIHFLCLLIDRSYIFLIIVGSTNEKYVITISMIVAALYITR